MAIKITATKANLIRAKDRLGFLESGFDLLDRKRQVLLRELMSRVQRAKAVQKEMGTAFEQVYKSLKIATITMGSARLQDIATTMPKEPPYRITYRSIMGVMVADIHYDKTSQGLSYGFSDTDATFDDTMAKLNHIRHLIYELAIVENAVYGLAMEIKKTKKRTNALRIVQIPKYVAMISEMEQVLEEKEREEFFRLKRVKGKKG